MSRDIRINANKLANIAKHVLRKLFNMNNIHNYKPSMGSSFKTTGSSSTGGGGSIFAIGGGKKPSSANESIFSFPIAGTTGGTHNDGFCST